MKTISEKLISEYLQDAARRDLLDSDDNAVIVFDFDVMRDRVARIQDSFGKDVFHATAVKTNPLQCVLKELVALGVGLEAASLEEVRMASDAGLPPERIVFDSPAKTVSELEFLRKQFRGIRINCDSLAELERIPKHETGVSLGLRVNPLVESHTVPSMNVGSVVSKFGESVSNRSRIVAQCCEWQALDCLHFHIGSQHQDFAPVVQACHRVLDLADEINERFGGLKISTIDIGGGFPVNYEGPPVLIEEYVSRLRDDCPRLFEHPVQIITEFGRYVHANAAFVASKVEYVKTTPAGKTAIIHVGADMFLRECYNPGNWFHKISVLDSNFLLKSGSPVNTDVAGPLCFGDDFVQRMVPLPEVSPGDWLVVRDVGANSFSLWSRHCSRPFPKVVTMDSGIASIGKSRESYENVISFWS